jgi:2'-5' RNA ligase superfamily
MSSTTQWCHAHRSAEGSPKTDNVRRMSRGVVLWPDEETTRAVTSIWRALLARDIPSLASHTHGRHQPHVSLVVGEGLSPHEVLEVLPALPWEPLRLVLNSAGVFPGGVLFLACVPTVPLLEVQRSVHRLVVPLTERPCAYSIPDIWTPHVTISFGLSGEQLGRALPLVLEHLPIEGWLAGCGVEDGDSGDRWPAGEASAGRGTG